MRTFKVDSQQEPLTAVSPLSWRSKVKEGESGERAPSKLLYGLPFVNPPFRFSGVLSSFRLVRLSNQNTFFPPLTESSMEW